MHGVRLVSTPPRKIAGRARTGLERSGSIGENTMDASKIWTLALAVGLANGSRATVVVAQSTHVHPRPAAAAGDTARMAGMADHAMSGAMSPNMVKHMELTP